MIELFSKLEEHRKSAQFYQMGKVAIVIRIDCLSLRMQTRTTEE